MAAPIKTGRKKSMPNAVQIAAKKEPRSTLKRRP